MQATATTDPRVSRHHEAAHSVRGILILWACKAVGRVSGCTSRPPRQPESCCFFYLPCSDRFIDVGHGVHHSQTCHRQVQHRPVSFYCTYYSSVEDPSAGTYWGPSAVQRMQKFEGFPHGPQSKNQSNVQLRRGT